MKKNLLLTSLALFCFSITFAQIVHQDYGEGFVVELDANYAMDIDSDGSTDFYINKYPGELGVSPILTIGCFASPSETSYTSFGARELQIFEEGELIKIDFDNMWDYIDDDDDRGSTWSSTGGTADSWEHMVYQYIGFAVFTTDGKTYNGWMKIAIDLDAQTLIIKELAYQDSNLTMEESEIIAGDAGSVAVKNLDEVLNQVVISPNPVIDIMKLDFDYSGSEKLHIAILDNTGKVVVTQNAIGSASYTFDTTSWTAGLYFVNFRTDQGVRSEKIFLTK